MPSFHASSPADFVRAFLPRLHGPLVTIRIQPAGADYTVSKYILTSQSPYFANMFDGPFKEGKEQLATLEELQGVVSVQSFELLLQWLYLGEIECEIQETSAMVSALIELTRLADMCNVVRVDVLTAQLLKEIIIGSSPDQEASIASKRFRLTSTHICSAVKLPVENLVRSLFAEAFVKDCFLCPSNHFNEVIRRAPMFAADLLIELQTTILVPNVD